MVVIKKRSNVIPVDFGEFQLNFPVSDGNIQRMKAVGEDLQAKGQAFQETSDEEALGALKALVEDGFNQVFDDEEAFKQVTLCSILLKPSKAFQRNLKAKIQKLPSTSI